MERTIVYVPKYGQAFSKFKGHIINKIMIYKSQVWTMTIIHIKIKY